MITVPEESLSTQLTNAVADLELKNETLANMKDVVRIARRDEVEAINRVNEAQKKFDALVALIKKSAPSDTDWKHTTFPLEV